MECQSIYNYESTIAIRWIVQRTIFDAGCYFFVYMCVCVCTVAVAFYLSSVWIASLAAFKMVFVFCWSGYIIYIYTVVCPNTQVLGIMTVPEKDLTGASERETEIGSCFIYGKWLWPSSHVNVFFFGKYRQDYQGHAHFAHTNRIWLSSLFCLYKLQV